MPLTEQEQQFLFELGNRIRILRSRQNMTQQALAEYADVSLSFLGNVERGVKNPSIVTLYKIANAFNIKLSQLLDLKNIDDVATDLKYIKNKLDTILAAITKDTNE